MNLKYPAGIKAGPLIPDSNAFMMQLRARAFFLGGGGEKKFPPNFPNFKKHNFWGSPL